MSEDCLTMKYLSLACEHLGIGESSVLSHRVYQDRVVLVVNKGILGCPKFSIPLSVLNAGEVQATSGALRLAKREGVDIKDVAFSVNYGRVTVYDVRNFIKARSDG